MKFNFRKVIIIFLFAAALTVGFISLFFGVKDTVALAIKTKDWFDAPGYFRDYSVYNVNSDGETTYRLRYVYYAGGAEYFVETDYGSEIIPEIDSVRTVLYEPENPENAVLKGGSSSSVFLYIGIMFTLVPGFMIICWLFVTGKIKISVKLLDFTVGFVIFAVGELAIYLMSGSLWMGNAFKSMGLVAIIPALLVTVGALQMIKTIFAAIKEKK